MRVTSVTVGDIADHLPLRQVMGEDGPLVLPAKSAWAVTCVNERGEIYVHTYQFNFSPEDFARASRLADRVREAGKIDESHWSFLRAMYGSVAWQEDGHEQRLIEDERDGL